MEARAWRIPSCRTRRSWISRAGAAGPAGRAAARWLDQLHAQRRAHPRPGERSVDLLNANWASRQKQLETLNDERHAVVDLRRRPGEVQQVCPISAGLHIKTDPQVAAEQGVQPAMSRRPNRAPSGCSVDQTNIDKLFGPGFACTAIDRRDAHSGTATSPARTAGHALGVKGLWFDLQRTTPSTSNRCCPIPATARWCRSAGLAEPGNAQRRARPTSLPSRSPNNYYNFPLSGDLWDPGSGTAETGRSAWSSRASARGAGQRRFRRAARSLSRRAGISTPAQQTSVARRRRAVSDTSCRRPSIRPVNARSMSAWSRRSIRRARSCSTPARATTPAPSPTPSPPTSRPSGTSPTTPRSSPPRSASRRRWRQARRSTSPRSELFIDAALRNITVFNDAGDGGSGNQYGNGLTNVGHQPGQPLCFDGGRHHLSTVEFGAAPTATLTDIVSQAMARRSRDDLAAHGRRPDGHAERRPTSLRSWSRRCGTTTTSPARPSRRSATRLAISTTTRARAASIPGRPAPWYQTAFGLDPRTSDPSTLPGRGVPDVSADAGGNMHYMVPGPTMASSAPTAEPARRRRCGPRSPRRSTPSSMTRACPTSATPTTSSTSPRPSRPAASTT